MKNIRRLLFAVVCFFFAVCVIPAKAADGTEVEITTFQVTNQFADFNVVSAQLEESARGMTLRFAYDGTDYTRIELGSCGMYVPSFEKTYGYTVNEEGFYEFAVPLKQKEERIVIQALIESTRNAARKEFDSVQFMMDFDNHTILVEEYNYISGLQVSSWLDKMEEGFDGIARAKYYEKGNPRSKNAEAGIILYPKESCDFTQVRVRTTETIYDERPLLIAERDADGAFRIPLLKTDENRKLIYANVDCYNYVIGFVGADGEMDVWSMELSWTYNIRIFREYFISVPVTEVFRDVKPGMWYEEPIQFVYDYGLMTGMGDGVTFAPAATLTRAQFATVIYRMMGEPGAWYTMRFRDMDMNAFYTSAVLWASENGIITGYTSGPRAGCFGPGDKITREQMAVIIYRLAKYLFGDALPILPGTSLSGYTDAARVSSFAREGMLWCNNYGIINGKTDKLLAPQANASRAECATIIMRLVNLMDEYSVGVLDENY